VAHAIEVAGACVSYSVRLELDIVSAPQWLGMYAIGFWGWCSLSGRLRLFIRLLFAFVVRSVDVFSEG
jgi:hypothetical protein